MQTFRLNYANIAEASTMVQNVLSPDGKMVMGKESKTLLVQDTPETLEKITVLLQTLDTRPRQVLIEAKIFEVTLDSDTTLGIDWAVLFGQSGLGGRLGTAFTQGFATNPLSGAQGFFLISALQERTNLNALASPKILAVDGEEAQILIGQKLGFRITTTTQTSTLESVEFLDVGTELLIRPLISDDGYILMNVHPKVSDGKVELGLPNETTTEATTSVLVKDGSTIVIGGLIRERDEEVRTQVPGLGDVPLLGALFRRREARKRKTEIAVLITPYIVREVSQEAVTSEAPTKPQQVGKIWDADFVMALSNSL
jgi:type II secretory pathway component GspD/PulD (secretin)